MDCGDMAVGVRDMAARWSSLRDLVRALGAPGMALLDSSLVVVPGSPERWSVLDAIRRVGALAEDLCTFSEKHGVATWAQLDDLVRRHAGFEGISHAHHAEVRFVGLELLGTSTESLLFSCDHASTVDDLGGLLLEISDCFRGSLREFLHTNAENLRRTVTFSLTHARPLLCETDPRAARFPRWSSVCPVSVCA